MDACVLLALFPLRVVPDVVLLRHDAPERGLCAFIVDVITGMFHCKCPHGKDGVCQVRLSARKTPCECLDIRVVRIFIKELCKRWDHLFYIGFRLDLYDLRLDGHALLYDLRSVFVGHVLEEVEPQSTVRVQTHHALHRGPTLRERGARFVVIHNERVHVALC